ncbi:MAG: ABC transporter permease [Candidatus Cloacimonetes bacterium]|nr:ABC transporter permease [Candidatus Cloacimonadota bacterium]MDD4559726.1 ABC transporter permease [Candidatus Cloacimonadota bacterium]
MAISLSESLHIGISDIMTRKVRSLVTILGIVLGVMCIMVVLAILSGMNATTLSWMEESGGINKIEVGRNWDYDFSKGGYASLDIYEVNRIRELIPEAKAMNPTINLWDSQLSFKGTTYDGPCLGVMPDFQIAENWYIDKGRFINNLDVRESSNAIVLGSSVARDLFAGKDPLGQNVSVNGVVFRVIGIMTEKVWMNESGGMWSGNVMEYLNQRSFIPISVAMNKFGGDNKVDQIQVIAHNPEQALALQQKLKGILLNIKRGKEVFHVSSAKEDMMQMEQNAKIFSMIFVLIGVISLLVGGIVIMNIMLASIKERTREIGVRIAVGARRFDIFIQFLVQTVLVTGMGGLLGIILGYSILDMVGKFLQMPLIANPSMIMTSLLVSVGVGLVFGIAPAIKAGNLDPVVALREE